MESANSNNNSINNDLSTRENDAAALAQGTSGSPGVPQGGLMKTKLRKKRSDGQRSGKTKKGQQKEQQSLRRRLARARWVLLMMLPSLMVLLHRSDQVELVSNGVLTVPVLLGLFVSLGAAGSLNEVFGTSHIPTYGVVFIFSFLWGGVILSIRDLTAARLVCMVCFGVCGGNLRYHWADDHSGSRGSQSDKSLYTVEGSPTYRRGGGGGVMNTDGVGYSSGSTTVPAWSDASTSHFTREGATATTAAAASHVMQTGMKDDTDPMGATVGNQSSSPSPSSPLPRGQHASMSTPAVAASSEIFPMMAQRRWSDLGGRAIDFLSSTVWRKVGLGLCATLGEVAGCATFVPNSWSDIIAVSWLGYAAVILVPIIVYKSASWLSHFLILICGTRTNTADASRLLLLYWVVTTVLSLAALVFTIGWLLASLVPYVWRLQLLVTPYSLIFELIAFESKEYQATNPYKEVAEVYQEHISSTMQNSKEYFLH